MDHNKKGWIAMSKKAKRRPRVSKKQLQLLEYFIWQSKDADEITKKVLIYLVRKSEGLSREVKIVPLSEIEWALRNNFQAMCRGDRTTHINQLFSLAGSDMILDYSDCAIADLKRRHHNFVRFWITMKEICAIVAADPNK